MTNAEKLFTSSDSRSPWSTQRKDLIWATYYLHLHSEGIYIGQFWTRHPSLGPNFVIPIQFSGELGRIIKWRWVGIVTLSLQTVHQYRTTFEIITKFVRRFYNVPESSTCRADATKSNTGRERLIRRHSSARFCFKLSGNSN